MGGKRRRVSRTRYFIRYRKKSRRFHNCMNIHDHSWIICEETFVAPTRNSREMNTFFIQVAKLFSLERRATTSRLFASPLLPARCAPNAESYPAQRCTLNTFGKWACVGKWFTLEKPSEEKQKCFVSRFWELRVRKEANSFKISVWATILQRQAVLHSQLLQFRARSRNRRT